MDLHQLARSVLVPLFVLNMAAIVVTLFMKKRVKPRFSASLDRAYLIENVIGLVCVVALSYISFFVKR